jgi:hypothetical protein
MTLIDYLRKPENQGVVVEDVNFDATTGICIWKLSDGKSLKAVGKVKERIEKEKIKANAVAA